MKCLLAWSKDSKYKEFKNRRNKNHSPRQGWDRAPKQEAVSGLRSALGWKGTGVAHWILEKSLKCFAIRTWWNLPSGESHPEKDVMLQHSLQCCTRGISGNLDPWDALMQNYLRGSWWHCSPLSSSGHYVLQDSGPGEAGHWEAHH
jgi:hypothetical protein